MQVKIHIIRSEEQKPIRISPYSPQKSNSGNSVVTCNADW